MNLAVTALAATLALGPAQYSPWASTDTLLRFGLPRGWEADPLRLRVLDADAGGAALLIRSPSDELRRRTLDGRSIDGKLAIRALAPEATGAWNSDLPFSLNEGAMWAGRGASARAQAGAEVRFRRMTFILAPEFWTAQNEAFQTFSYPETREPRLRHPLASPFHYPPRSLDLPQRLGGTALAAGELGQSSLSLRGGAVVFGAATERLSWGPGLRNQLVMSGHGSGFPHLFVQTLDPVETPLGSVHARWTLGRLSESAYFDYDESNDVRSLSAVVAVLNPSFEPDLSLGVARVVYAPVDAARDYVSAAFDFLRPVGSVASAPGDTLLAPGRDQLTSFFAHWALPSAGFEVWGEWGRYEEPRSIRDFLELPLHSRGYTLGVRYVRPPSPRGRLSLEAELTSLEPSQAFRVRQHGEWYASRRVPQGYTHRGRVIGAAIGPSGSSQWLAFDWLGDEWRVGVFGTRMRWENEALYSYAPEYRRADVTLLAGLRGGGRLGPLEVEASYAGSIRLNYLFQADPLGPNDYRGVDIRNRVVRLKVRAAGR